MRIATHNVRGCSHIDKRLQLYNHADTNEVDVLLGQESKMPYSTVEDRNGYYTMFSTSFDTPIKKAPVKIYTRYNNAKGEGKGKTKNKGKRNHTGEHLGVFISVKNWLKPYILDFKQFGPRIIYIRLATRSFELAIIST